MKKIQILINHYKEGIDITSRMLNSICVQTYKNIEVLLCTDNDSDILSSEYLSQFPIKIRYMYHANHGVGYTRNVLLDNADAEYVMFCDIDDCFVAHDGVQRIIDAADESQADIVGSVYKEEVKKAGRLFYYDRRYDTIRVHGKLFRLSYLRNNNIRFLDEMKMCGDQFFLWLAFNLTNKKVWSSYCFYIWKYNETSITRNLPYFKVTTHPYLMRTYTLLTDNLKKRGREDLYRSLICGVIHMCYAFYCSDQWKKASQEKIELANNAITMYIIKYRSIYDECNEDYRIDKFKRRVKLAHTYDMFLSWLDSMEVQNGC